jgi:hypothetical protein
MRREETRRATAGLRDVVLPGVSNVGLHPLDMRVIGRAVSGERQPGPARSHPAISIIGHRPAGVRLDRLLGSTHASGRLRISLIRASLRRR